jgi:acetoacetate decarboxylase
MNHDPKSGSERFFWLHFVIKCQPVRLSRPFRDQAILFLTNGTWSRQCTSVFGGKFKYFAACRLKKLIGGIELFKFKDNIVYSMPPFFGGYEFRPDMVSHINDCVQLVFIQTTDGNRLADYLPEGFELVRPELIIKYSQNREVDFLAGGSYNLVIIGVPASFDGKSDRLEGTFPLVYWENNMRPIIGGREESGQPKFYADIEDLHTIPQKYFANVSFEGNSFLRLEMIEARPLEGQALDQIKVGSLNYNVFGWRYIPKVGAPGAELSQPILYPQGAEINGAWIGSGKVQWTELSWEQNPVYGSIINALAQLPVKAMAPVMMTKGSVIVKPHAGRVLA